MFIFLKYQGVISKMSSVFQLLERRAALLEKSNQRRALLEDAYKYQQFERDCDETKGKRRF